MVLVLFLYKNCEFCILFEIKVVKILLIYEIYQFINVDIEIGKIKFQFKL